MFHGEVIMCLWNYILTFLRCCCWRSHWESLCTYVWKKANLSLLLFNPISNCVWGSLFLSPPPNDGSISVVISISNKTNFLMQTIKLFILTSDYLILSRESGQENVTIYHAKDNGGECPIYINIYGHNFVWLLLWLQQGRDHCNNNGFQLSEAYCSILIQPFYFQSSVCTPFLIPNVAPMIVSVIH
jgi:hypothetical protein